MSLLAGVLSYSQSDEETNEMEMQKLSGTGPCLSGLHLLRSRECPGTQQLPAWPTCATPHFSQVTLALPRLLAQLHHIPAGCLGGDWHLGEVLLVVTEVHGQKHLQKTKATAHGYFATQRQAAPWSHNLLIKRILSHTDNILSTTAGMIF